MTTPRDFVREPATWAPIQTPGQATFHELADVLTHHKIPLVGRDDVEMGPYTTCIVVTAGEADAWCARGYRKLTDREDEQSTGLPAGIDLATD